MLRLSPRERMRHQSEAAAQHQRIRGAARRSAR
jgi:hypothetical protein